MSEIKEIKEWLKKKEAPLKKSKSIFNVSGNLRTVDANVLLKYIQTNYILTKK